MGTDLFGIGTVFLFFMLQKAVLPRAKLTAKIHAPLVHDVAKIKHDSEVHRHIETSKAL